MKPNNESMWGYLWELVLGNADASPKKTEHFRTFPTPLKVRLPLSPPPMKVLIILREVDFSDVADCGDIVGTFHPSKHLKRRNQ